MGIEYRTDGLRIRFRPLARHQVEKRHAAALKRDCVAVLIALKLKRSVPGISDTPLQFWRRNLDICIALCIMSVFG
jgi:hypothetical protein